MALTDIIKSNQVICCNPYDSIVEVARMMRDRDVGAIVVTENEQPVGIITDRDIVVRCLSENLDATEMTAEDLMTSPVQTIKAEGGVYELIEQMAEKNVRRVVLVNDRDEIQGLVSLGDMLELLSVELAKLATATGQGRRDTLSERVA